MHNSILEYASTASISTVMTTPFHVMSFEKIFFEEVIFSSIIIKTPKSSRDGEKKNKRGELQESLQIK
jgi:hypothetical protein